VDSSGTAGNNDTAALLTSLRLRHLMPPLTVYRRTDEKELIHPKNLLQNVQNIRPSGRFTVKKEESGIV
jgi:hypothetical protein